MKRSGRVLSILLAASMTASLLPAGALGAGGMPPAEARVKTLAQQQQAGTVTYAEMPAGAKVPSSTNGGVTISSDTVWYLPAGETITINGATGTNHNTTSGTDPVQGGVGGAAITIQNGARLTIEGPGTLIVQGGTGGTGGGYNHAGGTEPSKSVADSAKAGGMGGPAIANSGTLEFGANLSGTVKITGGTGGLGGNGEGGKNNTSDQYSADNSTYSAGRGGDGGQGGVAVANSGGTVIFNQDSGNSTLSKNGDYAAGTVNIKGGEGGIGGHGGNAGTASVKITEARPASRSESGPHISQPQSPGTTGTVINGGQKSYKTYTSSNGGSDTVVKYSTMAANAGSGGAGNYGVSGGTVVYNRGIATIEGGNGQTNLGGGAVGGTIGHMASYNGTTQKFYTTQDETTHTGTWTQTSAVSVNPPTGTYGWSTGVTAYTYYESSYTLHTASTAAGGSIGLGAAGVSGVNVQNNGGTNYITGGYSYDKVQADAGTVSAGSSQKTGSLYVGDCTGYNPTSGNTIAVPVRYLEGAGDLQAGSKNFYVLNEGDTWTDANGDEHTSEGLLADETALAFDTRDLYVSPQGYLYITGVIGGAKLSFDLAVNATRHGSAGSETKDIRLDKEGAGVYHFTGTTAGVTARYALDSAEDGENKSFDSSFDVHWLQGQKDKFATSQSAPIEISTAPQLAAVAWAVNDGVPGAAAASYKLTGNLNLGNFDWTPIGTETNPFMGTFDGNGKTLYNLRVPQIEGVTGYGLFGWAEGATLNNFKLARLEMTTEHSDTLKNNGVAASATSGGNYDFKAASQIKAITDTAADLYVGAALGRGTGATVSGVTVTDVPIKAVTGKTVKLGGLVGYAQNSTITGSAVTNNSDHALSASAVAGDVYTGGIVGWADETGVSGNKATGYNTVKAISNIDGAAWAGGAVGRSNGTAEKYAAVANNTVASGSAVTATAQTGDAYASEVVGQALLANVTGNTATGGGSVTASTTTGTAWAGGAVGKIEGTRSSYAVVTDNSVTAANATVSAESATGDAYAAGLAGQALYANVKGLEGTKNTAIGYKTVKAESTVAGSAWAGGAVGKISGTTDNFAIAAGNEVTTTSGSVTATAKTGNVYAAGLVGQADYTDVTANSATGYTGVTATAQTAGAAWAGGGIGAIRGNLRTTAVATGNTVTGGANVVVTATAAGAAGDAHGGGFLGEGLEVAAYSNIFTGGASNAVNAYSPDGVSWAGGLLGHVRNEEYGRIAVSDMTVANVAVTAQGAAGGDKAGKESYAGGVIGQGIAQNGVELVNLQVKGSADVTAKGTETTYAGRLAGHVNKASVINCAFNNVTSVNISGSSSAANAYVGGLVGKLETSGSVNASGVWKTNVTASAAADKTAWAGGLLGYADETSITASSVNYKKPATGEDKADSFTESSLTVTSAGTTFAGGLAGEIVNTTKLNEPGEHTYKMNNAVSVTMTLPATGVTAGGLFGKLNDGLVGTSYARDYIITKSTDNTTPPTGKVAGVAGVLTGSELIAVYGVGKGGNVISAYPGMYAEGGGNAFYGCYVLHDSFAPRPERDVNVYGNTYYVGTNNSFALIPGTQGEAQEQDKPLVDKKDLAVPYYTKGTDGLYELKTSYGGATYQHTRLTGLPEDYFNTKHKANDSMWNLLHFYRNDDPGDVTTRYERRLGYAILFNRANDDIQGNFACPMFTTPYAFTLAVQPGLDYGHIKENKGEETYSTYSEPGTKMYTKGTPLIFTAEEQPTLPQDKVFYVFAGWKYNSGADVTHGWKIDETTGKAVEDESVTISKTGVIPAATNPIRINSVASYMTLTALFERRDNQIRGEINKALSDAMKAVTGDQDFVAELNELLKGGFSQDAANKLLDKLYASTEGVGGVKTANLQGVYDAFEKWVNTKAKTDLSGMDFGNIYPNAKENLWAQITDHEAVVKQIVRDAVEQVMAADRFQAGSYDTDISQIGYEPTQDDLEHFTKMDKLDFVDVGVELFTTGKFAKYEETQKAFEDSGTAEKDDNNNTQPGVGSFAETTATLTDLLNGKGSYALSYIDPATVGVDGVYTPVDEAGKPIDGEPPYDIWNAVSKGADGKYTYDIDTSKLVTDEAGKQYVYLRQTDENGYQVTTRIEVGCNTVAAENSPVNSGSANPGVGDGTEGVLDAEGKVVQPLRTEHTEMWFGAVDLAKGESGQKFDEEIGGRPAPNAGAKDKKDSPYYYNGKGGAETKKVFVSAPISGAYTEGLYVEIAEDRVADWTKLPGYDEDPAVSTVKEIFGEDGTTVTAYEVKLTGATTELSAANGLVSIQGQPEVKFKTTNDQPNAAATPTKLTGTVTYTAANGFTVKAKYVNLIGELNAAKEDITGNPNAVPPVDLVTPVEQVHNVLNDTGFAGAMEVAPEVMAAYDKIDEAATVEKPNPIDKVILTYRPTTGGYPDAGAVKDLFTYATALQELLDVMDTNQATIDSLSAADKTRVAELRKRAENLLSGKDYAGASIDPDALALNSGLFYNTGDNLFKLLGNVYYDSVVITIQTNFGGYVKPAKGGDVGKVPSFVTSTLFGQGLDGPDVNTMSLFAAEMNTLDSVAYVVGKNKAATLVLDKAFYDAGYEIDRVNGEPNNFFFEKAENDGVGYKAGDYIASLPGTQVTDNLNYIILFAKRVYGVTIPERITEGAEPDLKVLADVTVTGSTAEVGKVTHGDALTVKITPEANYVLVPGAEIKYQVTEPNGTPTEKIAAVNPDGTVTLPAATGAIKVTDLSAAIKPSGDKNVLSGYITTVDSLDRDSYRPETWTKLDAAKKAAETVRDKATPEATEQEIKDAFEALVNAQQALVKQYPVAPSTEFVIVTKDGAGPSTESGITQDQINSVYSGSTVKYYQDGVVGITKSGTETFYVQEGKEVELKPAGQLAADLADNGGKALVGVTYQQGDTTGKKATLVTDNNHIILPNVTGAVSNITPETKTKAFTVIHGGKDTTGEKGARTDVPVYTLPDAVVTEIQTEKPTSITVTVKDNNGKNFEINIPLADPVGNTEDVTVKKPDGGTVTLGGTNVTGITVTGSSEPYTATVPGSVLDKIVAAYNKGAGNKPKVVVGENTKVTATTDQVGTNLEAGVGTEIVPSPGVPTYTVIPKPGQHVTGVTVDKYNLVEAPDSDSIQGVIASDNNPMENGDGTWSYTKADPDTGGKITIVTDGKASAGGKPLSVTVDPGVNVGVTVTFPVDLTAPNYGEAEIVWKMPNNNTHTVTAATAENVYDFTAEQPAVNEGTALVKTNENPSGASEGTVTHGNSAEIVITPADNMRVDPNATVTIAMAGVQGGDAVAITDTLKNLADKALYPGLTVTGVNRDGTVNPNTSVIVAVMGVTGPLTVDASGAFRSAADLKPEYMIHDLKLVLDELKQSIDLGDAIVNKKTSGPYVTNNEKWDAFAGDHTATPADQGGKLAAASEALYDKLTKDGAALDTITGATTETALVDAVNKALGLTGGDKLDTYTQVVNTLTGAKSDLDDAILNLTPKTSGGAHEIPVLPGLTDTEGKPILEVGTEGAQLMPGAKPVVTGPADGGLAPSEDLTITPVTPKPGQVADKVTITVTDPATGKDYTAEIPVNGGAGVGENGIQIFEKNPDGTKGKEIPANKLPGGAIADTVKGGTAESTGEITVPGATVQAVVDAITGTKDSATGNPTQGSGTCVITGVAVSTKPDAGFDVGDTSSGGTHTGASVDAGVNTESPAAAPTVDTVDDTGASNSGAAPDKNTTIELGAYQDGLKVSPITPKGNFIYKGVEVTVVDKDGNPHVVTIPATTGDQGNTTKLDGSAPSDLGGTDAPYTTTILPADLAAAVKAAIRADTGAEPSDEAVAAAIVTGVKVVTDALPATLPDNSEVTGGNGINTDTSASAGGSKPTVTLPTAGTGTPDTGDLTVDKITPAPGFEVGSVVVEITDPNTGKTVGVVVPAGETAPDVSGDANKLTVIDPATGDKLGTVTLPEATPPDSDDKGGTVAAGTGTSGTDKVTVPGKTIQDIIDALKDPSRTTSDNSQKPIAITGGTLSSVTVEGKRSGHALPKAGEVTGDRGTSGTPTVSDGTADADGAETVLLPTEDLVVDNIKPKDHFQVDGVTVTLTDGTTVTLPKESSKTSTPTKVTVTLTTPNGVSETKEVAVPDNTGVTFDETGGTDGTSKITVDGDALEAILKEALKPKESGAVADTDIESVRVNTSAASDVIGLPETAGTDKHQSGNPTVKVEGGVDEGIIVPGHPTGSVVVDNINPAPAFGTKDVTIAVTVPTADGTGTTDYEVTIPADKPAPDLSKLTATPVDQDGKPTGAPDVIVDLSNLTEADGTTPRIDKGGALDEGGGASGTDKVTIPSATVADIIAKLTPDYTGTAPDPRDSGTVSDVAVNTERTGHKVPDHTTTLDDGVADKGIVQVWINNPTSEPSKLAPSMGLTVSGVQAKGENETVTGVTVTTAGGTVITVAPDGTVSAVKNGEALALGGGVKAVITDSDGNPATTAEPFDLALSGAVLDTILSAAGEKVGVGSVQKVEVNTEKPSESDPAIPVPGAPGGGSLKGWLPAAVADPDVVHNATQDLVVDNVKAAPGYTYTGVTLTLSDGASVSVPKQSVTAADGNAQVTVTVTEPDGTTTRTETVTLPRHVKSQTDQSSGAEKTTVPGASLDAIIKAALVTNDADVVRVDIDAEETGHVMPTAKTIKEAEGSHGLTALTIKNGTEADADQSKDTDTTADEKHIVVPHTGELVMELTYQKDDGIYGGGSQTYHTFSGLTVGGVSFDAATLESLGVVTRENSDALAHLSDSNEIIVLDAQKLAAQYQLTTGRDFPGFGDLTIQTVPQNSQYASFVENYEKLQGMLDGEGKPTEDYKYGVEPGRAEYEELVQKLADQFKAGTADQLQGDNLDHLLDKKVVLDGLQQEIDDLRKADQVQEGIGGTTDSVNEVLGGAGLAGAADIDSAIGKLNSTDPVVTPEQKQAIIDAVGEAVLDQIRDLVNDSAKLPDGAKDQVWTGGHAGTAGGDTAAKLDQLEKLLDAVERNSMYTNDYLNKLLNDLPAVPNIRGGDSTGSGVPNNDDAGAWDSFGGNSTYDGKSITDRISDLKAAEAAIDKAAEKINNAEVDDGADGLPPVAPEKTLTTAQRDALLDRLSVQQEKLAHELEDLAKVFAKDYLTTDDDTYNGTGSASANSGNGIKETTDKLKDLTSTGVAAFNKLPPSAQAAVDELFYGPTLSELHESAFATGSVSSGLLDKEGIFNALDKDGDHSNKTHLNQEDLDGDEWNTRVDPSDKTVGQWVDDILALEPSYNALTQGDKDNLNGLLTDQTGSHYPDLLDKANELVADRFIKDNHLNELGTVDGTLTPAQKDLVNGAKPEWNGLTDEQKAIVNQKVSGITSGITGTPGPTYEDLLDMLTPAPDTGDTVTVNQRHGGTVTVSPQKPRPGERVTITVKPNADYTANAPTVQDQSGKSVSLTDNGDGTYTYRQPAGKVTITGSFTKKPDDSGDTPSVNTGGGGGGASDKVTVEVGKAEHGSVGVDSDTAKKNDTVTITVIPDPGYVTEKVTVNDKDGKELPFTDNGDGTYTYTQPGGKVTVSATFRPISGDPRENGVADLLVVDEHPAYLRGRSAEQFAPSENMTRAEVAQMFYNLLKDKDVTSGKTFTDVAPDAWYAQAVAALAGLGVVNGVGGDEFVPERTITRAEFVVIATRFAVYAPGDADFSDVSGDFWAREAIGNASHYGWINGYTDGTFKPLAPITRAECVKVVNAMLARSADKSFIDEADGLKLFPDVAEDNWAFYEIVEATNAHDFTRGKDGAETWSK